MDRAEDGKNEDFTKIFQEEEEGGRCGTELLLEDSPNA